MTVRTVTRSVRHGSSLALAALLVCASTATAHAQEVTVAPPTNDAQAKIRAQALLSEGTTAYGRGDYATALERFTTAYQIFPSPKLWFNIGQANRDLGRPVEAAAAFDRFLRNAGDAPPETLAEARRSAAELKGKLGQIAVTCAIDGADITVDGKQVGNTPLGEMVWTTPGRHQVAVQHAGFSPAIEDVAVLPGEASTVNFDLRPVDLRAPPLGGDGAMVGGGAASPQGQGQGEEKPIYRRAWFWVATGALVGAGVVAGVLIANRASGSGGLDTTLGSQRAF